MNAAYTPIYKTELIFPGKKEAIEALSESREQLGGYTYMLKEEHSNAADGEINEINLTIIKIDKAIELLGKIK